ncbi:hypothetical protein BH23VER1_BH23VER1_15180 [soil metagenome]
MPDRYHLRGLGYEIMLLTEAVMRFQSAPVASTAFGCYDLWEHDRIWKAVARLREQGLIEEAAQRERRRDRQFEKLTESGAQAIWSGNCLQARWDREWNGQWELVLFDAPSTRSDVRQRLHRWLRKNRFGWLQRSVWMRPDGDRLKRETFEAVGLEAGDFVTTAGPVNSSEPPQKLAARAWDFRAIAAAQDSYLAFARSALQQVKAAGSPIIAFRSLVPQEKKLWLDAFRLDPLLPRSLYSPDYQGFAAVEAKDALLRAAVSR